MLFAEEGANVLAVCMNDSADFLLQSVLCAPLRRKYSVCGMFITAGFIQMYQVIFVPIAERDLIPNWRSLCEDHRGTVS